MVEKQTPRAGCQNGFLDNGTPHTRVTNEARRYFFAQLELARVEDEAEAILQAAVPAEPRDGGEAGTQ